MKKKVLVRRREGWLRPKKKGMAPKTFELSQALFLLLACLLFFGFASFLFKGLKEVFVTSLSGHLDFSFSSLLWPLFGFFILLTIFSFFFTIIPRGFVFKTLQFKWPKRESFQFFYPLTSTFLKVIVIALVVGIFVLLNTFSFDTIVSLTLESRLSFFFKKSLYLALAIASALFILSFGDFLYQKWRFKQEMKMSASEMKEEKKEEGPLQTKDEIKRRIKK